MKTSSKATFETFTSDGFHNCGTLAECKRQANELAARGVPAWVVAATDRDAEVYSAG